MNSSLRREIIGEENYILQHCVRCLLHFTLYSSVALDTALDSALNCYQYSMASTFYTGQPFFCTSIPFFPLPPRNIEKEGALFSIQH
ncbi:unnamed protein product [Musa banksii]